MRPERPTTIRKIATCLASLCLCLTFAVPALAPRPAYAQFTDPTAAANHAADKIEQFLTRTLVDGVVVALVNGVNQFMQQMAYQMAMSIVSGCVGQGSCFSTENLGSMVKNAGMAAAGEAIGSLSESIGFDLCDPGLSIRFALQLGVLEMHQPKPKCDMNDVINNWDQAIQSMSDLDTYKAMWGGFQPGQSPLSASFMVMDKEITFEREQKDQAEFNRTLQDLAGGGYTPITDPVTGNVLAPAGSVRYTAESAQGMQEREPRQTTTQLVAAQIASGAVFGSIMTNALSVFTQTLVAGAWNKLVMWLLTPEEAAKQFAPVILSVEGTVSTGEQEAANVLSVSMTPPPMIPVGLYDPLAQFIACPSQGRGLFNCVADAQLATAARMSRGQSVTIRDAIEKGYMHGEWPLISPNDESRTSDPNCYNSGYCYYNLKKLRAARVLPIGFEIVAFSSPKDRPYTLKQAVDGFYDCNDRGLADGTHPFCHMIDPNWVIIQPLAQCKAMSYGPLLMSPEGDIRQQQCVDLLSCLAEDDAGNCTGGWGYCSREKNIWRFDGKACPAYYNSCRLLESEEGQQVAYNLNTVDYGVCNADNAGCKAYATAPEVVNCTLSSTCTDPAGCKCEAMTLGTSCNVATNGKYCWNAYQVICDLGYICKEDDRCLCEHTYRPTCLVPKGERRCSTMVGSSADPSDDWKQPWARFFNRNVEACDAKDAGCTGLVRLERDQSLNLVRNGGFEELADSDGDGNATDAKYWSPYGKAYPSGAVSTVISTSGTMAVSGSNAAALSPDGRLFQGPIPIIFGRTYTLSAAFRRPANYGSFSAFYVRVKLHVFDVNGNPINIAGDTTVLLNAGRDCSVASNIVTVTAGPLASNDLQGRASCTFSLSNLMVARAAVELFAPNDRWYADNVMLEEGTGTDFHEAYGDAGGNIVYAKAPPEYLWCTGEPTDMAECADYAPVCRDNEVGCAMYTPKNGDPSVPGIVDANDLCPAECEGYDTFKKRATQFDQESFPNYFIPSTATSCGAGEVGCSEFTNVETEDKEYYSFLRLCQKPDETDSAVYYTWEGSDVTGYQLKVWNLKTESVDEDNDGEHDLCPEAGCATPGKAGKAPCTKLGPDVATCNDGYTGGECTRADIDAGNFDCREFYDADGNRHFRRLSQTILATADCHRYRITVSSQQDCATSGGKWDTTKKECVYMAATAESAACNAAVSGCRAYSGNTAANVRNVLTDTFEDGVGAWSGSVSRSSESVNVGGHSMKIEKNKTVYRVLASGSPPDLTNDLSLRPDASYTVVFWARGKGNLTVSWRKAGSNSNQTLPPVALRSDWNQYQVGPIRPGADAYLGQLRFTADPDNDTYVDNVTLSEAQDDFYVVRDSWKTPASCDRTMDGAPSPREMLGCRAYGDSAGNTQYLRSFSRLCRERSIGCAAYSDTRNTPDNSYSETHDRICWLGSICVPTLGSVNCPCSYWDVPLLPEISRGYIVLDDVCRVEPGQGWCRFHLDGLKGRIGIIPMYGFGDREANSVQNIEVLSDRRAYLALRQQDMCLESAAGCRTFGQPTYALETECNDLTGKISGSGSSRVCTHTTSGLKCKPASSSARSCTVFSSDPMIAVSWETVTLKDDPAEYQQTLCTEEAVGCGQYKTKDGLVYFKDPGERLCRYKEDVLLGNTKYDGWFRQDAAGSDVLCAPERLDQITGVYGIPLFGDKSCRLIGPCATSDSAGGCPCPSATSPICRVAYGQTTCGYQGWVGQCTAENDMCEEFIDPMDTSVAHPAGQPYYYLFNDQLDLKSCNGQASLREGCVLFDRTSRTAKTWSAARTYAKAEASDAPRTPYDCGGGSSADIKCGRRCFSVYDGVCADGPHMNEPCSQDIECGDGHSCVGTPLWTGGCETSAECETAIGERCYDTDDGYVSTDYFCKGGRNDGQQCYKDDNQGGWTHCNIQADVGSPDAGSCGTVTVASAYRTPSVGNDSNVIIKVRRDRSCSAWYACQLSDVAWKPETGTYEKTCYDFVLCEERNPDMPEECLKWVEEKDPARLTADAVSGRSVGWRSRDYSGYSVFDRYDPVLLRSVKVIPGMCAKLSNEAELMNDTAVCWQTPDCRNDEYFCKRTYTSVCAGGDRAGMPCDGTYYGINIGPLGCPNGTCTKHPLDVYALGVPLNLCPNDSARPGRSCDPTANRNDGNSACNSASRNYECVGRCDTSGDCPTPAGETKSGGTCIDGQCYYNFDGGPLETGSPAAKPSCRAYPESDSPFPASVLDHLSSFLGSPLAYGEQSFEPRARSAQFNGANVCLQDNTCECFYSRYGYGEGDAPRYNGLFDMNHIFGQRCAGGQSDGAECKDGAATQACKDGGGQCEKIKSVLYANGWPGFCIDRDGSMPINNTQDQFNCILWQPVDRIAGLPSPWNQQKEAGWIAPAGVNTIGFCTEAEGNASYGSYKRVIYDSATDGDELIGDLTGVGDFAHINRFDVSNHDIYKRDLVVIDVLIRRDTEKHLFLLPYSDDVVNDFAAYAGETAGDDYNGWINRGNPHYFSSPPRWYDPQAVVGYWDQTNEGRYKDSASWLRSYILGNYDYDDVDEKCDEWPGDERTGVAVRAEFDASDKLVAIWTLHCVEDNLMRGSSGSVTAILRESCTEFQTVCENCSDPDAFVGFLGTGRITPMTDNLYQAQFGRLADFNEAGVLYEHVSDDEGVLKPLGRAPENIFGVDGPAAYFPGSGVKTDGIPVPESEHGSPFNMDFYRSGPGVFSFESWTETAGVPLKCEGGNCGKRVAGDVAGVDAATLLKRLFATSSLSYLFDYEAGSWTKNFGFGDNRLQTQFTNNFNIGEAVMPMIFSVDHSQCDSDVLCKEGPAGMTVNHVISGTVSGDSPGKLAATIEFYAMTDKNRMPLRSLRIDVYGDGDPAKMIDEPGYYRNRRGLDSAGNKICGPTIWGLTDASCDPSFFQKKVVYLCTADDIDTMPQCGSGKYPCQDGVSCHFKPRVQVIDNWGFCNGICPIGTDARCINELRPPYGDASTIDIPWFGGPYPAYECNVFSKVDAYNTPIPKIAPWTWFGGEIVVEAPSAP